MQHDALCHVLFRPDSKTKLSASVIPLCNNSTLSSIISMMVASNAPVILGTWVEPSREQVQEFFDNLLEKAIRVETDLVRATIHEEIAYIASRAEEGQLAAEARVFGHMVADTCEEEVWMAEEHLVDEDVVAGEQGDEAARSSTSKETTEEQHH